MHLSAQQTGAAFFDLYSKIGDRILDVGSLDVNGTLKDVVPEGRMYLGMDVVSGKNVDIATKDPHSFPFISEAFNIIVSTSCFEHDEFFWLTFSEMARVVKTRGFIYISVPVQGPVHRHPIDAWRFYPDAGKALARWAQRRDYKIELVESFILPKNGDIWTDFVAVFSKAPHSPPAERLVDRFPTARHRN
jgi:SAM-dependent methyltransferase